MEIELQPAVRAARPSRSFALVPVIIGPALLCALVAYGAGRFDARPDRLPLARPAATAPARAEMIVNVAAGVTDIAPLVKLHPGETIEAINGIPVNVPSLEGFVIDTNVGGAYMDVTTTQRRIVMLFH